jgi:hypothetical protein
MKPSQRDSAIFIPITDNRRLMAGGWDELSVPVAELNDAYILENNDFTQIANMPFRMSHVVGGMVDDNTVRLVGRNGSNNLLVSIELDMSDPLPANWTWSTINADLNSGDLLGFEAASWGFWDDITKTAYIALTTDFLHCELWSTTDFLNYTYVCDLPDDMIRSVAWIDLDGYFYMTGGGHIEPPSTITNLIDKVYKFNAGITGYSEHSALPEKMRGLWPSCFNLGTVGCFWAGITDDADNATREGALWTNRYALDVTKWVKTPATQWLTTHAIAFTTVGTTGYTFGGHLNDNFFKINLPPS